MRQALIVAALLILPHLVQGTPEEPGLPLNGSATDAMKLETQRDLVDRVDRQPASTEQDPSLVPCPQVSYEGQKEELARLENHSSNCQPEEGAIQQNPNPDQEFPDAEQNQSGTPIHLQ
ncbi:MAG: hypothetical protein OM95_07105 [Bdellovibrio sp. ArHS]|uniref:hypothetical protein n=1 Tax=Bdellovibrio sp. ArHS TaxID=1569284 RepID=UPI000582CF80|nr:hypothetical protein [Bdellovibrio sp. ArHS]KHD88877.1 MAG: hypothetical protein OM95_07105 [Bdellovibrio sp. ArHS]